MSRTTERHLSALSWPCAPRRGFTLVELLVVMAIIAVLTSVLLPAMGLTRQMANAALCSANLRSMYNVGAMYAANFNGWTGPTHELYAANYGPADRFCATVPPVYYRYGQPYDPNFAFGKLTPLDAYAVLGYMPIQRHYDMRRYSGSEARHILAEAEQAICPLARSAFDVLDGTYGGAWGRLRATYFWSSLMTSYSVPSPDTNNAGAWRDNAYGPYKLEEIADSARTIWMGDGLAMTDTGDMGYRLGPSEAAMGGPRGVEATFNRHFRYHRVGRPWRIFGVVTAYAFEDRSDCAYIDWEYYHQNPCASHWDGHVTTYSDPGNDNVHALRKTLTRDGTDRYVPGGN